MEIALGTIALFLLLLVSVKTSFFQNFLKRHVVDEFPESQPESCMVCNKPYCRECEISLHLASAQGRANRLGEK